MPEYNKKRDRKVKTVVLRDNCHDLSGRVFILLKGMDTRKRMGLYRNTRYMSAVYSTNYTNKMLKLVKIPKNMLQNCE